ncbi:RagB/SusD family nutrient uptake outer membrane protein [Hymenobacter jeollabukensis]|uniref:RagB/SusD family nutrient uptake outer membrane protein n=1 Tax=Hymenobacter jeollabukensis TaxID=2025313 RepID=A0A5R8WYF4_9BACT|nr:RagB/SusD family nutrient uptake outer membrane protein [Hymenobacter jeollabukensis]TLM97165.1 RagB/SusD family nutrient uptake outer membrane protein [Hymenobacter jeollabukensis]
MKKVLIPVVLAVALLSGCNVLDKEPLTAIAPSNFFRTAQDAEAAITACYDGLQRKGCYAEVQNLIGNMPSDDCTSQNGDVRTLETINWNASTGQVYDAYRDPYAAINRANAVLKYVPGIEMNPGRRNEILGEARFVRALCYFNLVRLYGGVPLRLLPTETDAAAELNLPRATAEEVYALLIGDLTTAESLVPTSNPARATRGAVNALLARVYLTRRQWAPARQAAAKVLTSGSYSLLPSFNALFPADNKTESIFEIQFSGSADAGTSNTLPDIILPNPPATYSFQKFNIPTAELLSVPDQANDLRWSDQGVVNAGRSHASYVDRGPGSGNDNGPFVYKWRSNGNGFNSSDNYYVLRLAEVYLAYAEAANEEAGPSQDALEHLNMVRQRAGLPGLQLTDPEAANKQSLRREIEKQRRLELAFEGERWFDLIRYARHETADASADHAVTALDVIAQFHNGTRDPNYLLFPIPLAELNTNTQIQQNPGY